MSHLHCLRTGAQRPIFWTALLASVSFASISMAAPMDLLPQTKLRLTVVQFVAATGDYKRWDALGGDLEVGPDGSVTVPTLGSIDVGSFTADQLGAEIGRRLQAKLGLLDAPDASVQVLDYPPVYVVGNVATPGQYAFRPGMTIMHALALAGGEPRSQEGAPGLSETIRLQSDLDGVNADILRATARLARLKSEFSSDEQIIFPPELKATDPTAAEIMEQERRIFQAHFNEFDRQQTGLTQLAELYNAEIDALGQKAQVIDEQIAEAQKQVDALTALVSAGSATVSRLTDAERILSNLRSDKLDNLIATMTARENLNRSQRDLAKLQDEQKSNAALQLQQEQAGLEKMALSQIATTRMLRQSLQFERDTTLARTTRTSLSYAILRQQDGQPVTLDANEASTLLPGDLVKVTLQMELPGGLASASDVADATAEP
ncbi:SLBB domain-containing protein [Devosia sp.]|uniref:SLBB domain-containing protein n=1 Tax=Devosia sp. TaxID=1871048 RepID=UPI002AFEAC0F|nr:polysaccharide biosynthesis/export family protein [Devosia sp.]